MNETDVHKIVSSYKIRISSIRRLRGSFDKTIFVINNKFLMRSSSSEMIIEENKINRVRNIENVPKILYSGKYSNSENTIFYIILEFISGVELYSKYDELSETEIMNICNRTYTFLKELHKVKSDKYDIGHYLPTIKSYSGTWKSGHEKYWNYIFNEIKKCISDEEIISLLYKSNDCIQKNIESLDYSNGPCLLHNDFHPRNIIIDNNEFSGIIDWECSQFGEFDFDFVHLIHWSIFPPGRESNLHSLITEMMKLLFNDVHIPQIEKRFMIYLLEHDFMQLLWSKGSRKKEFVPKIKWWLGSKLDQILLNIE